MTCTDSKYDIGYKWLAENEERVRVLARLSCRRRYDMVDDLYAEAVDRVPNIAATYEPALGKLDRHMLVNLKWYFFKRMNAGSKRLEKHCSIDDGTHDLLQELTYREEVVDHFALDTVQLVMTKLSEYDRALLTLCHAQDMNFREIGELLGVSKGTARLHCIAALKAARQLYDEVTGNG